MMDHLRMLFLAIFLLSTPVAVFCAFQLGYDKSYCAIANSYAFSLAMDMLYLYPLLNPFSKQSLSERVNKATMHWILFLTVFTEVVFQIPHNIMVAQLQSVKGSSAEWPFYTYGFSDSRWNNYHEGTGLAPEVWLINWNDALLGIAVLFALIYRYKFNANSSRNNTSATVILVLLVVFRDATLWRETVEYMWDHHRKSYPFSTDDLMYRPHAIACLWTVNGLWLIAPLISLKWAYDQIMLLTVITSTRNSTSATTSSSTCSAKKNM